MQNPKHRGGWALEWGIGHSVATFKTPLSFEDVICYVDLMFPRGSPGSLVIMPHPSWFGFSFDQTTHLPPQTVAHCVPALITHPPGLPTLALSLLPESSHMWSFHSCLSECQCTFGTKTQSIVFTLAPSFPGPVITTLICYYPASLGWRTTHDDLLNSQNSSEWHSSQWVPSQLKKIR